MKHSAVLTLIDSIYMNHPTEVAKQIEIEHLFTQGTIEVFKARVFTESKDKNLPQHIGNVLEIHINDKDNIINFDNAIDHAETFNGKSLNIKDVQFLTFGNICDMLKVEYLAEFTDETATLSVQTDGPDSFLYTIESDVHDHPHLFELPLKIQVLQVMREEYDA